MLVFLLLGYAPPLIFLTLALALYLTVVELRDSEDDFRSAEEFGIDLSRRPGADSFAALDEV